MHTITLQFESESQAVVWFATACLLGAIPAEAGLRGKSALDDDRPARPSELVVTARGRPGRWLVESAARSQGHHWRNVEERRIGVAFALATLGERSIPVDPGDPLTQACECGHQAFWHGDRPEKPGSGSCEHDGDCHCQAFKRATQAVNA